MRWIAILFSLGGVVIGCATTRNYEESLEGWVGRPSQELIAEWGAPQVIRPYGGGQLFEYRAIDEETIQKTGRTVAGYRPSCQTFFQIDKNDRVSSWKWQGNNCTAK